MPGRHGRQDDQPEPRAAVDLQRQHQHGLGLSDVGNPLGGQIVSERAGICLDVSDGSLQDGAQLQIYNCLDAQGNIAQHYTMR
jgi:hypothetical protein